MEIIRNGADLSAYLRNINDIYESNGWGRGYSDEKIRKMFSASIYRLAVADGAAVGLLRAYGDNVAETHVTELAVHKNHQGKGYGSLLMKDLLDAFSHTAVYVMAFAENRGFFERFNLKDQSSKFTVYAVAARQ